MNCREVRQWLSPYLDSELDRSTTFAISEHLRVCADCRDRFDAEREIDRRISAGLNAGPMPDEMWRQVVQPLRQRRWQGWRVFLPLAAAACICLVAWMGWRLQPNTPEPHWMIAEFLEATEGGRPFGSSQPMNAEEPTVLALGPFADLVITLASEEARPHVMELVSVRSIGDAGGEIVEVRLNCCGEPVILRVAKRDKPGRLREFADGDSARLATLSTKQEVAIATRNVGSYVVVGVSRHPLAGLLATIHTQ